MARFSESGEISSNEIHYLRTFLPYTYCTAPKLLFFYFSNLFEAPPLGSSTITTELYSVRAITVGSAVDFGLKATLLLANSDHGGLSKFLSFSYKTPWGRSGQALNIFILDMYNSSTKCDFNDVRYVSKRF